MSFPVEWPTAYDIARLLIAAAEVTSEDPVAVIKGARTSRARFYVFIALAHRFPTVSHTKMMAKLGVPMEKAFSYSVHAVQVARHDGPRGGAWYSIDDLNRILATVQWPAMTQADAELRRQRQRKAPLDPDEVIEATPVDPERLSRVDRMKAWQRNEPIPAPEVVDVSICGAEAIAQAGQVVVQSVAAAPTLPVSSAAKALAAYSLTRPDRRAPVPTPKERRVVFAGTEDVAVSYRPSRPLRARGAEIVTRDLMGDPPPGRSALDQRGGSA